MKDLDFDELDKAVNSLMTGANAAKQPSQSRPDADNEKTLDITPTLASDTPPSFDELNKAVAKTTGAATDSAPVVTAAPEASSVPPAPVSTPVASASDATTSQPTTQDTQTPLAARRGGRFMDVVHPSSDMKKTVIPARPVSREGVTIGRSTPPAETTPETQATGDVAAEAPAAVTAPATETAAAPKSEWPDPLEMADFKAPSAAPQMTNDNLAADLLAEADKVKQDEKTDSGATAPLTSPFLADAKVEKRPLGSAATTPTETPATTEKEDKTVDNPDAQLPASPSETPVQLPEELQDDLMAIEADTHMGVPKTDESHPVEAVPEEKAEPTTNGEDKVKEKTTEPERTVPTGPISIPQQYREEPSTTDQKAGTIYDTDSYHKPLAHPAKKKPGWTWVVAIIVILIVGAGGGAALYFLGVV